VISKIVISLNLNGIMLCDFERLAQRYKLEVKFKDIDPPRLRLDLRVRWKCRFGCESYGKKKSCPPNVPDFKDCLEFVKSYRKAILFKFKVKNLDDVKNAQKFMLEAEKAVKKPYALATFPGSCLLCDEECRINCDIARPSLTALCIDSTQFNLDSDEMVAILFVE